VPELSSAEATDEGAEVVHLNLPRPGVEGPRPSTAEAGEGEPAPVSSTKPTLYHFPVSLRSQQVRLVLAEKQVEWTSQIVNTGPALENLEPWYAQLNSRLEVPTLEVDGRMLADPVEIALYIEQHFPGPRLLPTDPAERAEVMRWVEMQAEFPMRELAYTRTQGMARWYQGWTMRQAKRRLRRLLRKNPQLRTVYENKLLELEHLERGIEHHVAVRELIDDVEIMLDEIEVALENRKWLAGDTYTLADLMWTAILAKFESIGFARSLRAHRRPRVAAWYAQLRERPSWDGMQRHISASQALRFYGPAVAKTFLLAWVIKWAVVLGIGWLVAHLS
jgi:glutathione S-transferase